MIRWKPTTPASTPQRWQSREEILKAHLDSLSPDELRRVRPSYYWLRFGLPAWQRQYARKYDPDQPRVPAGSADGGQWAGGGADSENHVDVQSIVETAKRLDLAARPDAYQRCLNLCYRLLERPQSRGSDRNTWDFHKCMNACLGRNL
jgi:hypothetical protein